MNTTDDTPRQRRTDALLKRMHGLRDEFAMLKGVMCACHQQVYPDAALIESMFDNSRIAQRLDQMNRETMERYAL